jgi:hypothetical protein
MATGRIPTTANSPLTAKGDIFTFSTGSAKLAVGNDGQLLTADSTATTGLSYQSNFAAGKNKIINGAMDIWQRGTSFTVPNLSYLMDRFYNTGDANLTVTRDTDVPTSPYFTYSAKCVGTTTESFAQKIESFNSASLAGQTVTISLYAKKTAGTGALNINLYYPNVKDTYGAVTQIGSPLLMSSNPGSSWARYSVTTTLPANVVNGLLVLIDNTNSHTIFITGVQVEVGSTATAFQTATGTIQGELAACQRYYYLHGSTSGDQIGSCWYNQVTEGLSYVKFPVTMRTAPTLSATTGTNYYTFYVSNVSDGINSLTIFGSGTNSAGLYNSTEASGTVGTAGRLQIANTGGFVAFTAEL